MEWKLSSGVGTSFSKSALDLTDAVQEQVLKRQDRFANPVSGPNIDIDLREVYFLIMHFLSSGPCQRTFNHLRDELMEHELLPQRYHAWFARNGMDSGNAYYNGISLPLSYDKLVERYPHVENDHLVKLLQQLLSHISSPLHGKVERNAPNAADVPTLLGSGSFSLLDRHRNTDNQRVRPEFYLRWPHMRADQVRGLTLREIGGGFTKHHRAPSVRSACYAIAKPSTMVQKMQNIKKLRGHSNAVYCAIFDRSGRYVITGSDDRLVKIWSMDTAFCLVSCRGHEGDITDLAVSSNNVLVASASNDFVIRVWHLPDGRPMSVLRGHTGAVTTIAFSPRPNSVYQLLSSSDDGTCRIWDARHSSCSPRIYMPSPSDAATGKTNIRSNNVASTSNASQSHQILCCAYNANGTVFVTGSSDSNARVWSALLSNSDDLEQPVHELDVLRGHENDVNYVQFSGCAVTPRSSFSDNLTDSVPRFKTSWFCHDNIVTCSRDGSAIIWTPRSRKSYGKSGRWTKAYHLKVPPPPLPPQPSRGGPRQRFLPTPRGVNMIVWSLDNRFVLAAIMDCRICVWNASDGSLVHCLTGHTESSYVLDVHPFNPRIAMSAGYDGRTIIWDIWEGAPVRIYEIGRFKLVDGKFSQDGTSIVLSDEVGQIYFLNTGQGESQKEAKYDQFFLGDYRPLIRDPVGNALDQETQLLPYLRNLQDLLCDSSMFPYPEPYQSTYQKRRLGALGREWKPSSIKFITGPDYNLGHDYIMPPLEDLDRMIEPLPEFIDAMYWEPEIEVISDDNDSEYNAEEVSVDETKAGLCSSSSSDLECGSDDSDVERIHKERHHQPKKGKSVRVESATSSGRHVKKRTLDENDDSVAMSKRSRNTRRGRKAFSRKSSDSMTLRPQRIAARNARTMLSEISGSSMDVDVKDESEDSLDSESKPQNLGTQESETDGSLQTVQPTAKSSEVLESLKNDHSRKKLILKIPAKKPMVSVDSKDEVMKQTDLRQSFSRVSEEGIKENVIDVESTELGSSSADAISILSQNHDRVNSTDYSQTLKSEHHLEKSAADERNVVGLEEHLLLDASSEPFASHDVIVKKHTDLNRNGTNSESKESPPKKLLKMRFKVKLSKSPSKLEPAETAQEKCDFISEGPSSTTHILDSRMHPREEACSSRTITRENASSNIYSYVPELNFAEAPNDSTCKTRSAKEGSRLENVRNGCIPVRLSRTSPLALKKQESPLMGGYDQMLSDEFLSSSRVGKSRENTYHANEQSSLTGENLNITPRKMSWLTLSEHEEGFRYIPQLGDEVAYLRQGHQEYLQSTSLNETCLWSSHSGRVNAVEFCKVEKLEYGTFPGSGDGCCRMNLIFVDPSSDVFGKSFNLTFPDLVDFPDFIVEKTRYDAATERNWAVRDKCRVWWKDESDKGGQWWEGKIVCSQAKSNEFPDSPWERYSIRYEESTDTHLHSPWELFDPDKPWERSTIEEDIRDKLLSGFAKREKSSRRHQDSYGIQKLNEASQKLDFCNRFPVPLYPELIHSRLENRYYRTIDAFKHDMEVMISNAESYFAKNPEMILKTRRLSKWFQKLINKVSEE